MTRDTAIKHTQALFEETTEDFISARDIFIARGRNLENEVGNKAWLSNYVSPLKKYNLVVPQYTQRNGKRVLNGIKLTLEGRMFVRNLMAHPGPSVSPNPEIPREQRELFENGTNVSLETATGVIAEFKRQHPEFEVVFEIKLRGSSGVGIKS